MKLLGAGERSEGYLGPFQRIWVHITKRKTAKIPPAVLVDGENK